MSWTTLTDELPISFRTCQGCRERSLSCRTGCAGWQYREAEKQERYRRAQAARDGWMTSPLILQYSRKNGGGRNWERRDDHAQSPSGGKIC